MEKYKGISDEELIRRFRSGEKEIMDFILEKYKPMVRKKTKLLYLIGGENDDLIQEGMIGLFQAIRDFEEGQGNSFSSFAFMCIRRQMYTAITASNRKKHQPLNSYISFDEPAFLEEPEKTLEDTISADEKNTNPEQIVLDKEQADMIESVIVERLSSYEKKVLHLFLEGYSYDHIAQQLHKSRKGVDNAIQRIRRKFNSLNQ